MPNFRFNLPINSKRQVLGYVVTDAQTFGGGYNTNAAWLHILQDQDGIMTDNFIYQFVIDNLTKEDASYLILKYDLTLVREEL